MARMNRMAALDMPRPPRWLARPNIHACNVRKSTNSLKKIREFQSDAGRNSTSLPIADALDGTADITDTHQFGDGSRPAEAVNEAGVGVQVGFHRSSTLPRLNIMFN